MTSLVALNKIILYIMQELKHKSPIQKFAVGSRASGRQNTAEKSHVSDVYRYELL